MSLVPETRALESHTPFSVWLGPKIRNKLLLLFEIDVSLVTT